MVATKRLPHRGISSDSEPENTRLRRMHEVDVSGMESMLRRTRNQLKKTTPLESSPLSKMIWTRNDELVILAGIVDYENETKLSYRSDWDAFYRYIKDSIEAKFSRKQLRDKIKNMKKRFTENLTRSNGGKGLSFTSTDDDDDVFQLSTIIWAKNETECASDENMDQAEVLVSNKDVPCAKHEGVSNKDQGKNEDDVPFTEHERVNNISMKINNNEKEKSEEDGVDEPCVLQDALEADTLFRSLGIYQQKSMLQNLKNIGAETRKELTDDWKALLVEEMQLYIKKQTFSAKLSNAGVDDVSGN